MSVSVKTLQKEVNQLRAAIDKQTQAGVNADSLISTLKTVETRLAEAEKDAAEKLAAKPKKPRKKAGTEAEAEEPAPEEEPEPENEDPRLQGHVDYLNSLLTIEAERQAVVDERQAVVADIEARISKKTQQHTAIEQRRALGDEKKNDAADLYMLALDLKGLGEHLVVAREAVQAANSDLHDAADRVREQAKEVSLIRNQWDAKCAVERLAELEKEIIQVHEQYLVAARATNRPVVYGFRFSQSFKTLAGKYGFF